MVSMVHLLRLIRRALGRRDAVAAVEFALVAAPFVFALLALIESGLMFVASIDLSNATMSLGRQIRTGAVMASGASAGSSGTVMSLSDFKAAICNKMQFIPTATCTNQLQVDVRNQSSFGSGQSASSPVANNKFNNASLCFNSGQGGSVVEFRAFYLWQINTPVLLAGLVNATSYTSGNTTQSGNYHVITSAEAFRVEQNGSPNNNSGSSC